MAPGLLKAVLTEGEPQEGFELQTRDLLVFLRRGQEVLAAFPIGTSPQHVRGVIQTGKMERSRGLPDRGSKDEGKAVRRMGNSRAPDRKGLFLVFEGGDGAGKQTQAIALWQRLRRAGYAVVLAEEPGSTLLGRVLKTWLTVPPASLPDAVPKSVELLLAAESVSDAALPHLMLRSAAPRAELLLFVLARAQLVEEFILPRLAAGDVVICSRYAPSTVAYQGYGQGLNLELVKEANKVATQGLEPDVVFLLDLSPEEGLARKARGKTADAKDHFEDKELSFHHRVRQGYLEMAAADPQRWVVVDATLPPAQIRKTVWNKAKPLLG